MKANKFKLSGLSVEKLEVAKKGVKITGDNTPTITTGRSIHRFSMNGAAAALMGAQNGDRVILFINRAAENLDQKFFIGITNDPKFPSLSSAGKKSGKGVSLNFTYAGIFSEAIQEELDTKPCTAADLERMGLAKYVFTQEGEDGTPQFNTIVKNRVQFVPVLCTDEDENGNEVPETITIDGITLDQVFVLTDRKVIPMTEAETEKWNLDVDAIKKAVEDGTYVSRRNASEAAQGEEGDGDEPMEYTDELPENGEEEEQY